MHIIPNYLSLFSVAVNLQSGFICYKEGSMSSRVFNPQRSDLTMWDTREVTVIFFSLHVAKCSQKKEYLLINNKYSFALMSNAYDYK